MVSIENKISTPWKTNSTEDAEMAIDKNLNKIYDIVENFIINQIGAEGNYSLKIGKSEVIMYGLFGTKKKIVTYYGIEQN